MKLREFAENPMVQSINQAQLECYRASSQKRERKREQQRQQRQQQGWRVARQADSILKQFGAKQVKIFGSMLYLKRIHNESDLDLAVEGLPDNKYLQAVACLLDLSDLSVDLVQIEHTTPNIRAVINKEGIEL